MVYYNKLIPFSFADDLISVSDQKDSLSFVSLWLSDISIDISEEDDNDTGRRQKINTVDDTDFCKKKEETYVNYTNNILNKIEKRDQSL